MEEIVDFFGYDIKPYFNYLNLSKKMIKIFSNLITLLFYFTYFALKRPKLLLNE